MRTRGVRARGAALVTVMVFSLAVSVLVMTLLSLTQAGVRQEWDQHRRKALQGVLESGIAAAVNEVNRERRLGAAYVDPEGNGPGAVGVTALSQQGIAVRDANGRLLGRFRTVVERASLRYGAPPRDILLASAAFPDFGAPQHVLAAEVEVTTAPLPFPANALDVLGHWDETKKFLPKLGKKNDVRITAPDADVPAISISDPHLHADFVADLVPEIDLLAGGDPLDPGTLVSGAATVANTTPQLLNEQLLEELRTGIATRVAAALPTAIVIDSGKVPPGTTVVLPEGTYRVGKWELGTDTTLRGAGTLIVTDELRMKDRGTLEWDGDIIVIDDTKAAFKVEDGGDVTLTNGVLAVVSEDADAKLEFKQGSTVVLGTPAEPAAVAVIAGGSSDSAKFSFKSDEALTINGVLAVMATKKNEVKFETGAQVDLNGSLSIVLDGAAGKKTELKLEIKDDSRVALTFHRPTFDKAMKLMEEFFDPDRSILPVKASSYWERPAAQVVQLQAAVMSANPPGQWGLP